MKKVQKPQVMHLLAADESGFAVPENAPRANEPVLDPLFRQLLSLKESIKNQESIALLMRMYKTMIPVISQQTKSDIYLLSSLDDTELTAAMLEQVIRFKEVPISTEARLRLEGAKRFQQLIEEAGGTYDIQQVCEILNVGPDTVRKRVKKRQLIAISKGDHYVYPVWQFTNNKVLNGLQDVLNVLVDDDATSQCVFMLTPLDNIEVALTPVDLLKRNKTEDKEIVLAAASQHGVHGAK